LLSAMTALVGGEVEGNVSQVIGFLGFRAKADKAGGEDLADLGKPLGGAHQIGVEGVVHRSATEARHSSIAAASLDQARLSLAIRLEASACIAGI
jgi:hypothetical protein